MNERMSYHPYQGNRRRRFNWLALLLAVVLLGAVCFAIPFGAVLAGAHTDLRDDPQVMVIFGCQVRKDGPSILLRDRLDTALDYLEDHPDMTVVVTGGKGDDEHLSEAQAMYDYLTERGIDGDRVHMEDQSVNTRQNVEYTMAVITGAGLDTSQGVLLVSNGFHLTRIRMLWERAGGPGPVSTLAAPTSHVPSLIWMHIREPLALVKSFFLDR